MRFLIPFSILLLAFQATFGSCCKHEPSDVLRAFPSPPYVNTATREFCSIAENHDTIKCKAWRIGNAFDEAEYLAKKKKYCEKNKYDFNCIMEFGIPMPWN